MHTHFQKGEILILIIKKTDTLTEKTKTTPQETLEFKMNKPTETFSFDTPLKMENGC